MKVTIFILSGLLPFFLLFAAKACAGEGETNQNRPGFRVIGTVTSDDNSISMAIIEMGSGTNRSYMICRIGDNISGLAVAGIAREGVTFLDQEGRLLVSRTTSGYKPLHEGVALTTTRSGSRNPVIPSPKTMPGQVPAKGSGKPATVREELPPSIRNLRLPFVPGGSIRVPLTSEQIHSLYAVLIGSEDSALEIDVNEDGEVNGMELNRPILGLHEGDVVTSINSQAIRATEPCRTKQRMFQVFMKARALPEVRFGLKRSEGEMVVIFVPKRGK